MAARQIIHPRLVTENNEINRRAFLQGLSNWLGFSSLAYLAGTAGGAAFAQEAQNTSGWSYNLQPWTGDDFTMGHQLRGRRFPAFPEKVEKTVDFVIIGGGIAGLTSAYYLRDHDFLLLEQYDTFGGQSRGSNYRGIGYSYGAAYMNDMEDPVGSLLSSLSLKPIKLANPNSWRWENAWAAGVEGSGSKKIYSEFKRLLSDCKPIWKELDKVDNPVPLKGEALVKLDNSRFSEMLTSYNPAFIALLDTYLRSSNCGGVEHLSSLAALLSMQDLFGPSYVFPGGNPALATALFDKIKGQRCQKGFVWSVQIGDGKSTVVYTGKDGGTHKVQCKHVIITAPPLVAARILGGIPDEIKATLLSCKFGSYLVANIMMKRRRFIGAYDNFVSPPFTFADITVAETPYLERKTYEEQMGSVLTIYQPYPPASPGRTVLTQGDRQKFADSILQQLGELIGNIQKDVEGVVLSRWGHAMAITSPGFYGRISQLNGTGASGYTLAHCSSQGLACAESAIIAARLAANRALRKV